MLVFLFILCLEGLKGQEGHFPIVKKDLGDAFSIAGNPAGPGEADCFLGAFSIGKPLGIPGLSNAQLALIFPAGKTSITAGMFRSGTNTFSDTRFSAGAGKKLGKLSIGARINYRVTASEGYLPDKILSLELGTMLWMNENSFAFIHFYDITGMIKRNKELPVPVGMSGGIGCHFSGQVFGGISWTRENTMDMSVHAMVLYVPVKNISLRSGIITGMDKLYLSTRYSLGSILLDIRMDYHQMLGFTPSISIFYEKE